MRGATVTCPKCTAEMPVEFSYCGKCGTRLLPPEASETRQVTVLFADISGFTALAERLDPEELHENMRTAWDAIAAEIRATGGLIEKYIGDAVVAVFGAVGDEPDHPERAQRAALAILGALDRENARIAERTGRYLALRVGVNTGLAMAGAIGDKESEFGVLGDAVNVAARLEQAAEPGEILVGDATYRLTPGLFTYEPHPPVAAKGKTAPRVGWRLLREETAVASDRRRTPLVGRDGEIALLLGALDDALASKGRIVSIVGEAGLGKTRLVDEVLADPRALGARVARARCSPYDSHRAYGAIADLLRRALAIGASAPTEIAHRTITETLPGLEPETTKLVLAALGYGLTLPPLSGDTRRKLLDRAIRDLILRVARTQPVILAITDVQWSDTASQAVLTAIAPALANTAALVITTYRPELTPPWTTARGHLQLRLGPLDESSCATLLASLLPAGALPKEAIADVVARSSGNPTYIEEAARWILGTGVVVEREDASPLADVSRMSGLPEGLPMLLLRRAEQATHAGQRAESLHVLGDALHHYGVAAELARRLPSGGADERARALLRACDAARLLGRDDALAIAEEGIAARPTDMVLRAALGRRAGELAARKGEIQRSAEHLADADRLTPAQGAERAELTLAKAFLARSDDRPAEALIVARAAVKEALAANDRALALEAEEAAAQFAADAGSADESLRATERCVEHAMTIGDLSGLARALASLTYAALDRGDLEPAEDLANQFLGAESRLGDVAAEAGALRALGRVYFGEGRLAEAESTLDRALALADEVSQSPEPADPSSSLP